MQVTKYKSMRDVSTWILVLFVFVSVAWTFFMKDSLWAALAISVFTVTFVLVTLFSIYYKIVDNELWVYGFFRPSKFPIDKISEIKSTKSMLSAPATSFTHRLAIKFSDRKILKSSMPVIISPDRQKEFIDQLLSINPNIKVEIKQ